MGNDSFLSVKENECITYFLQKMSFQSIKLPAEFNMPLPESLAKVDCALYKEQKAKEGAQTLRPSLTERVPTGPKAPKSWTTFDPQGAGVNN